MILKRGYEFGESRVICNAHWYSDVEMGRIMGNETVKRIRSNQAFQRDFEAVKEEVLGIIEQSKEKE